MKALAASTALGWWGFPWGIVFTPVQIIRNLGELVSSSDPSQPSDKLRMHIRRQLSVLLIEQDAAKRRAAETKRRMAAEFEEGEGLGR